MRRILIPSCLLIGLSIGGFAADEAFPPFPPTAEAADLKPRLEEVRALARDGRHGEALTLVDTVLAEHPRSVEAWELKGDIAAADGNQALARTAYREAARLKPERRIEQKLDRIDPLPLTTWAVRVGGLRERFSEQRGVESALAAGFEFAREAAAPTRGDYTVHGRAIREDRFNQVDTSFSAGGSVWASPTTKLLADGSWTQDPDWHSKYEVGGGIELSLIEIETAGPAIRIEALGGLHHQQYDGGRTLRGALGMRLDLPGLFALEGRWLPIADDRDSPTSGFTDGTEHKKAVEVVLRTRVREWHEAQSSIGLRQGDEVEPPLTTAKATTVFVTIAIPLDRQFTLEVSGQWQDRDDAYTRLSLGGELVFRF